MTPVYFGFLPNSKSLRTEARWRWFFYELNSLKQLEFPRRFFSIVVQRTGTLIVDHCTE